MFTFKLNGQLKNFFEHMLVDNFTLYQMHMHDNEIIHIMHSNSFPANIPKRAGTQTYVPASTYTNYGVKPKSKRPTLSFKHCNYEYNVSCKLHATIQWYFHTLFTMDSSTKYVTIRSQHTFGKMVRTI